MLRVALANLRGRTTRLLLSAGAVIFGVAFLTGVQILANTIRSSSDSLIDSAVSDTAAVVRSSASQQSLGAEVRQTVPDAFVAVVDKARGVESAHPVVQSLGLLIGPDNRPIGSPIFPPTTVFQLGAGPRLRTRADRGTGAQRWRRNRDRFPPPQTTPTLGSTTRSGCRPTTVLREFTIVGFANFSEGSLNVTRVALLDTDTAHEVTGTVGQAAIIAVNKSDGFTDAEVVESVRQILPPGVEVLSGEDFVAETAGRAGGLITAIGQGVALFAVVGMFVGAIVIYNTFSILVAQRAREFALLRATGASRRQVTLAVLYEAIVVGVLGSALGVGLESCSLRRPALRSASSWLCRRPDRASRCLSSQQL